MEILRRVRIKPETSLADQAAGSPEGAAATQVIVLKEHQDILLVDLYDSDVHRLEVHRPEREDQLA